MTPILSRVEFESWPGRVIRRIRRRRNDQCITVVTYHSISPADDPLTHGGHLRMHPDLFEAQVEYFAENFRPTRLNDVIDALRAGRTLDRAVVLTFDDGYADTLRRALPILFRRRIPMTVFPVTSVLGNTDLMWQHKLDWLVAHGHADRVATVLGAHSFPQPWPGEELADHVRRCYRPDVPDLLEQALRDVGTTGPALAAALRPYIEFDDVARSDPEFVEFGNHTHTHAVLAALTPEQQRREILDARNTLIALTGRIPRVLAYPFGLKRHYNADSRRIAAETGHHAALDMRRRINAPTVDPFEMSRKPAPNDDLTELERLVEDWPANAILTRDGGGP